MMTATQEAAFRFHREIGQKIAAKAEELRLRNAEKPIAVRPHDGPVKVEIRDHVADEGEVTVIEYRNDVVFVTDHDADAPQSVAAALSNRIPIERIQRVVSRAFGISRIEMLSHRRTISLALPRQVAMYLAKQMTMRTLPEIGLQFRRNHTSILHAVRKIARMIEADDAFRQKVGAIRAEIEHLTANTGQLRQPTIDTQAGAAS